MKYKLGILLLALVSLILLGTSKKEQAPVISGFEISQVSKQHMDGKAIIEQICSDCHSTELSHEDLLAPPLAAVKDHYMKEGISENEFVDQLSSYILDPKSENSKMRGAINRFGVMPKPALTDEQAKEVAAYIFNNELEKPEWYKDHKGKGQKGKMHKGMKKQHGQKSHDNEKMQCKMKKKGS